MNLLRVLHTNLWQSHPYTLCPKECWNHMFPIIPPGVSDVRVANLRQVTATDVVLPFMFANAHQEMGAIIVRDGACHPSSGKTGDHAVIVPPDHPHFDYLKSWVERANEISDLHERVLRWLAKAVKGTKSPIRTIRKSWPFMADLASQHKIAYNYAAACDCDLDRPMMENYESIIAKGMLNPPINADLTVVHPSNLTYIFKRPI